MRTLFLILAFAVFNTAFTQTDTLYFDLFETTELVFDQNNNELVKYQLTFEEDTEIKLSIFVMEDSLQEIEKSKCFAAYDTYYFYAPKGSILYMHICDGFDEAAQEEKWYLFNIEKLN